MSKTRAVLIRKPYQNSIGQLIHVGDKVVVHALHGMSIGRRTGIYGGYYVRDMEKHPYHKNLDGDTYISAVRVDGVPDRRYNYTTRKQETYYRCGIYPRKDIYKIKQ